MSSRTCASRKLGLSARLGAPLIVGALTLLGASSPLLASGSPPCDRGDSWGRGSFRIIIGGGGRWVDHRRDSGRHDDLLYRGSRCEPPGYFGLDADAWCDLADGRYLRAKHEFLDLIECRPCEPVPRIGYAIASGRLEHWREAQRSMRRAVELDVKAFDALCVDLELKREIRCLIDEYECLLRHNHCDPDVYFMLASLKTLLGDYDGALCAIENAQRYGDCSASARLLKCHIESKLCHGDRGRDSGRDYGRDSGRDYGRDVRHGRR